MLDLNPELSVSPEATRTFPGQPGLIVRARDGTQLLTKFCLQEANEAPGRLSLVYTDDDNG